MRDKFHVHLRNTLKFSLERWTIFDEPIDPWIREIYHKRDTNEYIYRIMNV